MVLDEAELPEVLRDALRDARKRAAERRARKAAGGEGGADEGPDDVEEFDVADLITGEFGDDEDDDDDEDPDYSPADAADEDMGPGELVRSTAILVCSHFSCALLLRKYVQTVFFASGVAQYLVHIVAVPLPLRV